MLYYVPLEPYEDRYTFQLLEWCKRQFNQMLIPFKIVHGDTFPGRQQKLGQVLDAFGRPYYAMSQTTKLLCLLESGIVTSSDIFFFEDMFHPGIESLAYAMDQMKHVGRVVPRIYMRCLAQTIDPDDFVHYTKMERWMRHYEKMVCEFVSGIFLASSEMKGYIRAAGWKVPVYVTGLPFCKSEVQERAPKYRLDFDQRDYRIVFASRIAAEKQPEFLASFAQRIHNHVPNVEVAVLSGTELPYAHLSRWPHFKQCLKDGTIVSYPQLTKAEYYKKLCESRLLFNCSLQDWVSNTASEADACGCNLLVPAYRSFPEAMGNDFDRMYTPWSVEDAATKASALLSTPCKRGFFSNKQDGTNYRTITAMTTSIGWEIL